MAKTIIPKEQTGELQRARLEFLKRNPEKLQEFRKLFDQNEKRRNEFATHMATLFGKHDQESKESWDFLLSESLFDKDFKEILKEIKIPPAANTGWHFLNFAMDHGYHVMEHGGENLRDMTRDALNEKYLDYLCRNARGIFTELTNGHPLNHLLVGIDLRRTKEVILAEVSALVTQHQDRTGIPELEKIPQKRFKWLSIVDELLDIWDTWAGYGQRRCFSLIAKKKKLPESTVKARWRMAYRLINGQEYSKEVAAASADELCAKCTDQGKCYRTINKVMDFYPCAAYLKLTGKSYTREDLSENLDEIADQYVLKEAGISKKTAHKNPSI